MDNHFKENALSWGSEGATWLEDIPKLIEKYEREWSLQVLAPFPLNYNFVAPALRDDGTSVVIKIGFPGDREFKSEIEALGIFRGEGIVNLLEKDESDCVILIERCEPAEPLSAIDDDGQATRIIAAVAKKLHKPLPSVHSFIEASEWSKDINQYLDKYGEDTGPVPIDLVVKANETFKNLLATSETSVLVHGDLHHDNVLFSDEHGWVAIDPKGIAVEPLYEVGAMIRNPYEKLKDNNELEPLLKGRISILSEEFGAEPNRVLDWCFTQTILSAIWSVDGAKTPDHALRVAKMLDSLTL